MSEKPLQDHNWMSTSLVPIPKIVADYILYHRHHGLDPIKAYYTERKWVEDRKYDMYEYSYNETTNIKIKASEWIDKEPNRILFYYASLGDYTTQEPTYYARVKSTENLFKDHELYYQIDKETEKVTNLFTVVNSQAHKLVQSYLEDKPNTQLLATEDEWQSMGITRENAVFVHPIQLVDVAENTAHFEFKL